MWSPTRMFLRLSHEVQLKTLIFLRAIWENTFVIVSPSYFVNLQPSSQAFLFASSSLERRIGTLCVIFIQILFFFLVAGLLLVAVHSGSRLLSMDEDGFSDPYCIVTANREKVRILRTAVDLTRESSTRGLGCEWPFVWKQQVKRSNLPLKYSVVHPLIPLLLSFLSQDLTSH